MSPAQIDIADMQSWVFRLAQKRWRMQPAECARIFKDNGVFDYLASSYGILHLSSYESALNDIERYLENRGVRTW